MIKLNTDELGTLAICALRYCHGRQTYMPKRIQDIVKAHLSELSDGALRTIEDDLNNMRDYDFGDPIIDRPNWQRFRYAVEEERSRRWQKAEKHIPILRKQQQSGKMYAMEGGRG